MFPSTPDSAHLTGVTLAVRLGSSRFSAPPLFSLSHRPPFFGMTVITCHDQQQLCSHYGCQRAPPARKSGPASHFRCSLSSSPRGVSEVRRPRQGLTCLSFVSAHPHAPCCNSRASWPVSTPGLRSPWRFRSLGPGTLLQSSSPSAHFHFLRLLQNHPLLPELFSVILYKIILSAPFFLCCILSHCIASV